MNDSLQSQSLVLMRMNLGSPNNGAIYDMCGGDCHVLLGAADIISG